MHNKLKYINFQTILSRRIIHWNFDLSFTIGKVIANPAQVKLKFLGHLWSTSFENETLFTNFKASDRGTHFWKAERALFCTMFKIKSISNVTLSYHWLLSCNNNIIITVGYVWVSTVKPQNLNVFFLRSWRDMYAWPTLLCK